MARHAAIPGFGFLIVLGLVAIVSAALPGGIKDTQKPDEQPPTPQESLAMITVPKGFSVTLFAGEPDVAQPIDFAFDDRGRLWVAECYSYHEWKPAGQGSDRILVFEDTDGDGRFDRRKVFWDKAYNLTSVAVGFGGVWACCAPHLLFIPDADGDDVPDAEPIVKLDGWTLKARHNIYNGLAWGPDGWLWGRHGIVDTSKVGAPGTPEEDRTQINCGVWRYHPVQRKFDAVAHGTTNPWGMDFDDHGEAFFTNCVIAHLWHVVPGAHYQRMYGQDFNRFTYELMPSTSDHLHWAGGKWTESRGGHGKHSEAGGGHAHCGGMIYLGDNWPDEFRGDILTCNIHGNRLNRDRLERHASGYVGRHSKDLFMANNPWFRGTALKYGPDGGVYISDWTDFGECHDKDGVHRSSGRIYKMVYGKPAAPKKLNLAALSNAELVKLQLHKNDWFVRRARLVLQQRFITGPEKSATHNELRKMFATHPEATRRLRAMWTLHATGGADDFWLLERLNDKNEHVRAWAIRLLSDGRPPIDAACAKFAEMAVSDESALVRLYLASVMQRMPPDERWDIATGLVGHAEDDDDVKLALMIWYGIQPAVPLDRVKALKLAAASKISKVRLFVARRVAEASQ